MSVLKSITHYLAKMGGWLTGEEKKLLHIVEQTVNVVKAIDTSPLVTFTLDAILPPDTAKEWQDKILTACNSFLSALSTITPCINAANPSEQFKCIIALIQASTSSNRTMLLSSLAAHIYSSVTRFNYSHALTLTQAQYNDELKETVSDK
jgi:hypothetical protein